MITQNTTHEQFVQGVREIVLRNANLTDEQKQRLEHTKLLYGVGQNGVRGVCHFEAWQNGVGKVDVVEISAMTQEHWIQLAGTTIHELAHVLAGSKEGHSNNWKDEAQRLGFVKRPEAAGQKYALALFNARTREDVYNLAKNLADGAPAFSNSLFAGLLGAFSFTPQRYTRPCSAGFGVRGGKSRGAGSGSRMRKYVCETCSQIIRAATDTLDATHADGGAFILQ